VSEYRTKMTTDRVSQGRTLQMLFESLAAHGDATAVLALRDGAVRRWSHGELDDTARRLAGGLAARGLARGEAVVLLAPNSPEWIVARLALIAVSAMAVPLDDLIGDGEIRRALADSGAKRVFATGPYIERIAALGLAEGLDIWRLDEDAGGPGTPWRELLGEPLSPLAPAEPSDVVSLFYTSGTTGSPKGVPLTHGNILGNLETIRDQGFLDGGDRVLVPLPLHHSYPFIVGMLLPLLCGATIILPAGITGPEIAKALSEGRATAMVGVPRLYRALVEGIQGRAATGGRFARRAFSALFKLSSMLRRRFRIRAGRRLFAPVHRRLAPELATLACGGAALDPRVEMALEALGWEVINGYGLVETSSIATYNPRGEGRMGSVGKPVPGVQLRIAEIEDAAEEPGEGLGEGQGEIQIKGPTVFGGYRGNEEANRASFTADGWFRTGDMGRIDEAGYLQVTGRLKELIVMPGGKNVTPELVEKHYAQSPYVAECAVLELDGALVALIVPDMATLRESASGRYDEVIRVELARLSQDLPSWQRISGFAITRESLPKTRLGKYRRFELPEIYRRAKSGEAAPDAAEMGAEDRALIGNPETAPLWEFLQARFPERRLTLDTAPQLDLGIDSLGWVNLSAEMEERLGTGLDEEAIARVMTLRDMIEEFRAARDRGAEASAGHAGTLVLRDEQARWIRPKGAFHRLMSRIIYAVNRALMRGYFTLEAEGVENLPIDRQVVVGANHVSDLDAFLIGAVLPWKRMRNVWWGGEITRLFHTPLHRFLSRSAGIFPVNDRAGGQAVAAARSLLERGESIFWFPESWRSPDGRIQRFLPGIGMMLDGYDGPVVPAFVEGAFEAMPRDRHVPRRAHILIRFGPARSVAELIAAGSGESEAERIATGLRAAVAELAPESLRGDRR
jgi:long-chain acyl-CoA synthetase